jgi:hypothetical protein
MADEKTEDSQGVHSPPLASPRESLSDSEISWTSNEEEVDQDLASVDFSSDFTSGPGRTDIIKAIASRWSKNIVKKAGQRIDKVVKIQDIKERMKGEPFLRAKDKFSFLLGVMTLLLSEYTLISYPKYLYVVYTAILLPLITWRFFSYHQHKHHYFMLDFCYFDNLLLLIWLYIFPQNLKLFKLVFALSTGPLLMAVIAWSNSLVFHDIDRVTSLFIHLFPPTVLYAERWHNPSNFSAYSEAEISWSNSFESIWVPFLFYVAWQVAYLVKTEVMDRKRMDADSDIVTSARWLTRNKPHAIYKWLRNKGVTLHENVILILFQLGYTLLMLLPAVACYTYHQVNIVVLLIVLIFATWNGANYYFEIFSERYRHRLQSKQQEQKKEATKGFGFLPSSTKSVLSFSAWLGAFMTVVTFMIHSLC